MSKKVIGSDNMKAVIYARYSSDNQREESIEGQLRECLAFAERKGYTVIKTYVDRAITGKKAENRPEFQQMIADSAIGEFDVIIVWKLDRFSRKKYDSVIYKYKLKKNGVSIISATEPIDNSPEGRLMESIFEGFGEYYSDELAQKTGRGMTENAIKGTFNGGTITYGYTIDKDKHFHKDPATAPIVTEIFERYAEGEPIRNIVDMLNSKGIKTNNGRKFTYHFINWLLKNRRYLGEYTFRDITNNEAIPPLVTAEIFEKCQKRLSTNKHKSASFRKVEEKYLLTGKVFCGYCGNTVSGISGTGKDNKRYRYYQCMTSKTKKCHKKPIKKDLLENSVIRLIMQMFNNKSLIKRICDTCYSLQSTESTELTALKKQLKQNKKEINNIMKAIKAGLVTKSTKAELEHLEDEQERLEIEITKEQIVRPIISREFIEAWIMAFAKSNLKNQEQKQRLIDIFVNCVYVYDDKIVVMFNYKDGERAIMLDDVENAIKKRTPKMSVLLCLSLVTRTGIEPMIPP